MRRATALVLLAWLAGGAMCRGPLTPPPHGYADGALPLAWDEAWVDTVNCARADCERWFRVTAPSRGDLSVGVRAIQEEGAPPQFIVELRDEAGDSLARETSLEGPNVSLQRGVFQESYLVSVVAAPGADVFDFSITAGFRAAPVEPAVVEPPPPPKFVTHRSQVLEAEGYGQEAVAVFIESGASHGVQVGDRGVLIDAGEEIGRVVVDQVFPDGSRLRVEGALVRPVTHETIAEIELPAGRAAGDEQEDGESPFPWDDDSDR